MTRARLRGEMERWAVRIEADGGAFSSFDGDPITYPDCVGASRHAGNYAGEYNARPVRVRVVVEECE